MTLPLAVAIETLSRRDFPQSCQTHEATLKTLLKDQVGYHRLALHSATTQTYTAKTLLAYLVALHSAKTQTYTAKTPLAYLVALHSAKTQTYTASQWPVLPEAQPLVEVW